MGHKDELDFFGIVEVLRGLLLKLPCEGKMNSVRLPRLQGVDLFGVSWGAFVARQTASVAPDRIRRLALLVLADIANGSHWKGLAKMALPLLRYRVCRSERNLRRMLDPLFNTWDADWAGYTGDAVRDMSFDFRIPPLATDVDLQRLTMPMLVLRRSSGGGWPVDYRVS